MHAVRLFHNSKTKKIILVCVAVLLLIFVLAFLCSIHFRLDYYLLHFSIDTHDFIAFEENETNFNELMKAVDEFIEATPGFFDEYAPYCIADPDGLMFYKNALPYPDNKTIYAVERGDWNKVLTCLKSFPDNGFGKIYIEKDYTFFASPEKTARVFVHTNGERPKRLIDEFWQDYEFVRVIKLAHGWYDIQPIGRKHT